MNMFQRFLQQFNKPRELKKDFISTRTIRSFKTAEGDTYTLAKVIVDTLMTQKEQLVYLNEEKTHIVNVGSAVCEIEKEQHILAVCSTITEYKRLKFVNWY